MSSRRSNDQVSVLVNNHTRQLSACSLSSNALAQSVGPVPIFVASLGIACSMACDMGSGALVSQAMGKVLYLALLYKSQILLGKLPLDRFQSSSIYSILPQFTNRIAKVKGGPTSVSLRWWQTPA